MHAKNIAVLFCILVNIIFVLVLTGIVDITGFFADKSTKPPRVIRPIPSPKPQPPKLVQPIKSPTPPAEETAQTLAEKLGKKYTTTNQIDELIKLKQLWQEYRQELEKITMWNNSPGSTITTITELPKRARIITLVTDDTLEQVLSFIGSIHKHYPPHEDWMPNEKNSDNSETKLQITVYGLGVGPHISSHLTLLKNVEFVDAYDLYVKLEELDKPKMKPILDQWRPIAIFHATNKYGKVIYIDSSFVLARGLDELEKALDDRGAVFMHLQGDGAHYAPDFEHCHVGVQAYQAGSIAYHTVLAPQIRCAFRVCAQEELKMYGSQKDQLLKDEAVKKQLLCTREFNTLFDKFTIDNGLKCEILKRDDLIFGDAMLPNAKIHEIAKTRKTPNDARIHVALGFPSTSRGTNNPTIMNTPFMTTFLPSFLASINKGETKYYYKLYLGFDTLDAFFDNEATIKAYKEEVAKHIAGFPVSFDMIRITYSRGWVVYLWNALFHHAIAHGADYFYQLNDDISFTTPGWTEPFVNALKQSRIPDVGVVSPTDRNNPNIFTQSMVSKKHYDIFGTFYPNIYDNWYSDDWMTHAYVKHQMAYKLPFYIVNAQVAGTRYTICSAQGPHRISISVPMAERMIDKYLSEHK